MVEDPEAVFERRLEVARQSGVPAEPLARYAAERRPAGSGVGGSDRSPIATSSRGSAIATDLGEWVAYETPGHSPSHVCLFQPERRLLISGDHLLGRISLYFEYGYSPDPVGEFLDSLDASRGSARACAWPGTGAPSPTCRPTSAATASSSRSAWTGPAGRSPGGEQTAFEIVPRVYGEAPRQRNAHWLLSQTLGYPHAPAGRGRARRIAGEPERWKAA